MDSECIGSMGQFAVWLHAGWAISGQRLALHHLMTGHDVTLLRFLAVVQSDCVVTQHNFDDVNDINFIPFYAVSFGSVL